MASLITVRINKGDSPNLGFRLQGGKDFGTPLVIQKVNGGSPAERAGLIAGDSVIKINNTDVFNLRHKDAQDVVVRAGHNFEITVQRGGSTWRPTVVSTGSSPTPTPSINHITPVTKTSLAATKGDNWGAVGTGHNVAAKPFSPQLNGAVNGGPKVVNKQYNSPIKLYSEESIAETLSAQTEVLPTGALGVNFKKNEKNYDASNSAVLRALKESESEPKAPEEEPDSGIVTAPNSGIAGLRHVQAPESKPAPSNPQLPPGQNICADCERLIVGVFVRIKDKNLHVECFKCSTCGTSLKNVGYYNINNKLYCDIHAKSAAIRSSANPNLVPVTVPPGGKAPVHAISSALASHSLPSPSPLSPKTNTYASPYQETKSVDVVSPLTETNNNSSSNVYSNTTPVSFNKFLNKASSNFSGPRPFSSVSSPLSPHSTLPRAPLSPVAPAPASYSPASSTGRSVPSIVWPPQQEKTDLPTACPLFYPPPSQVEQKLRKPESEADLESEATADCSELEEINNLQYLPMEMFARRKSSVECVETIHESLDTQRLVENIMKTRVETSSQVSEPPIEGFSQCPQAECCQGPETCKITPKSTSKIENSVPLKWESSLTQAIRTTSPDPDTFSRIPPTKRSGTALASALLIAPNQPFTPSNKPEGPVPLPEETVPYFPPERPVIPPKEEKVHEPKPKPKLEKSKTPFVKALETAPDRPFTPVGGAAAAPPPPVKKKAKDPYEKYFEDLEKPSQKMSMLAALTIAPERTYSPLTVETVEIQAPTEKESKIPTGVDKSQLQRPLKPETLPESFQINKKDPKPPSYYSPSLLYERTEEIKSEERTEETNTSTTTTIEKQTIQNPQVTQIVLGEDRNQSLYPPMFKGFSCSFQNKTDHSQFSVEIQTDPPVITKTAPIVQTVETQPSVIQKETIKEEKVEKKQEGVKTVKQSEVETVAAKQAEEIITIRASPQVALRKVEGIPHYQVQLGLEAEADLLLAERKRQAQARMEQQKLERSVEQKESTKTTQATTEQQRRVEQSAQQKETVRQPPAPVIKVEPDPSQSFKPVVEERPPSRTFSPRPGTVTPSMINRPPSVLPHYQANLVPQHMAPVSANVFDPKSPAVSRSPSPYPGKRERSPSPFPRSGEDARAVSPAPGPPENPLQGSEPLPTPQDSRVNVARESLSTFIPEYKSKRDQVERAQGIDGGKDEPVQMYVSNVQSQSFPLQPVERQEAQSYSKSETLQEQTFEAKLLEVQEAQRAQRIVSETSDGIVSKAIDEQRREAHLEHLKQSQSQSVETSADGSTQVQRRRVVTEEFERTQKETNIQIETKTCRDGKRYPFQNARDPAIEPIPTVGGRVADPQKRGAARRPPCDASSAASPHSSLTPRVNPPSSVKDPNVSPQSSGIGGGRQAGGVSVAPRRGRGVLNAAALAGSRVPLCGSCNMHIRGPFITALGKIWCPNHFICATPSCRRPLQDIGFVEERGQLYCEYCFEQYLAPPCSKCSAKIKGDCLKAIGKNFHPECFNCTYCGKLFGNSPFFLEDGSPYCEADWNELFTTKCFACGFPVEAGDRWVEALNNNYHSQCFNCTMCKKNLEGQSFFAKGGRPFCKNHAR